MRVSLIAWLVNHLLARQETQVQFLGWEDSLEKEMETPSSILAWRIPWTEEPGRLHTVHRIARIGHDLATKPPPPSLTQRSEKMQKQRKIVKGDGIII